MPADMAIATAWCVFITHPPQEVYNQFAACWPASLAPPPSSVMNLRRLTRSPRRRARAALRDRQPERLGRGQIDDEIEFGRLLDRDVARLRATQNFIDITSSAPEKVQKVRSIGHQTSRFDPLSGIVNCGEPCGEHQGVKSNTIGK